MIFFLGISRRVFTAGRGDRYATHHQTVRLMAENKKTEDKSLVVKSTVGDYLRAKDVKVSSELYDELNAVLKGLLDRAAKRCEGNGRKTVMVQDL